MLLKVLSSWKILMVLQLALPKQTAKSAVGAGRFYQMLENIRTLRYAVAVIRRSDRFYGAMNIRKRYVALYRFKSVFLCYLSCG